MAWKLALPLKMVALNTVMMASFLFLVLELLRTESGRGVLSFFLLPAAAITIIDVVFMILNILWTSVSGKLHRVK
jgi:hypothetical protein